jgi:DNA-directed RNA polymerase sigma subunit (sigma70/sigma32)
MNEMNSYIDYEIQQKCRDKNFLDAMRDAIDEREYEIICRRLGLYDGKPLTYTVIGKLVAKKYNSNTIIFSVSGNRILQMYSIALKKIKLYQEKCYAANISSI